MFVPFRGLLHLHCLLCLPLLLEFFTCPDVLLVPCYAYSGANFGMPAAAWITRCLRLIVVVCSLPMRIAVFLVLDVRGLPCLQPAAMPAVFVLCAWNLPLRVLLVTLRTG
jgi:hypothetical protein